MGPPPVRRNSTSSGDSPRCTLDRAPLDASSRAIASNIAGDTEYGACGARLTPHAVAGDVAGPQPLARRHDQRAGSGALKPSTSWKTCAAIAASRSSGTLTRLLLMSPITAVPAARASAIARRAAPTISSADGLVKLRRSATRARTQASKDSPGGTGSAGGRARDAYAR